MALQLETPITTIQGFEIANAYGRVSVVDSVQGNSLQATVEFYAGKVQFEGGLEPVQTNGINTMTLSNYDRTAQGADILSIAHEDLIASLAAQGIVAVKELS